MFLSIEVDLAPRADRRTIVPELMRI